MGLTTRDYNNRVYGKDSIPLEFHFFSIHPFDSGNIVNGAFSKAVTDKKQLIFLEIYIIVILH